MEVSLSIIVGQTELMALLYTNYTFARCSNWLVKLTTGVTFTNVLGAAFMCADPKSAKKTVKLSSFIALLGSARVKAACRMLVKLTPEQQRPLNKSHSHFVWQRERKKI